MNHAPPADAVMSDASVRNTRTWVLGVLVALVGLVLLAWFARKVMTESREDAQHLFEQARAAWMSGRLAEAEARLAAISKNRPLTIPERLLRAQVAKAEGRIDDALAALLGVPDSDPDAAVIWLTRGLLEFERNRPGAAEAALFRALAKNAELAEARRGLIDLYAIQGRRGELGAQFRALARRGALTFDDLYLWCQGRRQDVGPAEIAAKLEQMVREEPDDRLTRMALAENHRRLGRLDEAEADLTPLSDVDPEARAARARIAIDHGAADEAARLLEGGPPDHAALARLRGRLALGRGEAAAVVHFRAALASDPDDRDTLFGLGQSLRLAGQGEAAKPYLEAARARDHVEWLVENARSSFQHDDPKALSAIGDACKSLGRLPAAQGWYRLALARDPLAADLQKRLFELDAKVKSADD
jgi:tetratricopeptide (TPR) repeat protein